MRILSKENYCFIEKGMNSTHCWNSGSESGLSSDITDSGLPQGCGLCGGDLTGCSTGWAGCGGAGAGVGSSNWSSTEVATWTRTGLGVDSRSDVSGVYISSSRGRVVGESGGVSTLWRDTRRGDVSPPAATGCLTASGKVSELVKYGHVGWE